jgi:hypothetical protein
MLAPFAALETRVADAVVQRLANVVVVNGAASYGAIFDRPSEMVGDGEFGVRGGDCMLTYKTSDDSTLRRDNVRLIGGVSYRVTDTPRPDADGRLSMAYLERV